jgi:hypothetical protein
MSLMNPDEHFELEAWLDFARGLGSTEQRTAMQRHASLCTACAEMTLFFSKVWEAGRGMAKETVPDEWLRKAEDVFAVETLHPLETMPVCIAVLAFDSLSATPAVNVRADLHPERHVLYHAPDCALYMKLEEAQTSKSELSIVGQITDKRSPDRGVSNNPVFLLNGTKVLVATSSNEFGEFQLACKPKRGMQISFPFNGSRINVSLDEVLKEFRH